MAIISININNLHSRQSSIRRLLRPLRRDKKRDVGCKIAGGKHFGGKIVAAHDGSPSDDPLNWYFKTFIEGIWGQYFELWKPYNNDAKLLLERAYLHIFKIGTKRGSLKEFLFVHCDPNTKEEEPLAKYKKGPHLHVKAADEPLPKSHFALNMGNLDEVLTSLNSLTKAIEGAVRIISDEVLKRCQE